MLKLQLKPNQQGYALRETDDSIVTELLGGPSRVRKDSIGPEARVECVFTLTLELYQYLRAFYNLTRKGTDPFIVDLIVETAALREHICTVAPGTWKLQSVKGHTYTVQLSLDVRANTAGLDYEETVDTFVGDATVLGPTETNLRKLKLLPDSNGYRVTTDNEILATSFNAPKPRMRLAPLGGEMEAELTYSATAEEYDYLRAFYILIGRGTDPFFIDLVQPDAALRLHIARMKSNTWKLTKVDGGLYVVRFTVVAVPEDGIISRAALARDYVPFVGDPPEYPGDFGGE